MISRVQWLGYRTGYKQPMQSVKALQVTPELGIVGDYTKSAAGRQITMFQQEFISAVDQLSDHPKEITMFDLRRNLAINGLSLNSVKRGMHLQIGEVIVQVTGGCPPCERMIEDIGQKAYEAMIGIGGLTGKIILGGYIYKHDLVNVVDMTIKEGK